MLIQLGHYEIEISLDSLFALKWSPSPTSILAMPSATTSGSTMTVGVVTLKFHLDMNQLIQISLSSSFKIGSNNQNRISVVLYKRTQHHHQRSYLHLHLRNTYEIEINMILSTHLQFIVKDEKTVHIFI